MEAVTHLFLALGVNPMSERVLWSSVWFLDFGSLRPQMLFWAAGWRGFLMAVELLSGRRKACGVCAVTDCCNRGIESGGDGLEIGTRASASCDLRSLRLDLVVYKTGWQVGRWPRLQWSRPGSSSC